MVGIALGVLLTIALAVILYPTSLARAHAR
jgi:hypothetical protein